MLNDYMLANDKRYTCIQNKYDNMWKNWLILIIDVNASVRSGAISELCGREPYIVSSYS